MSHWYVMKSKPHKEKFLRDQLHSRGIDVFYPEISVPLSNLRSRKLRPYFPGYLFVHLVLEQIASSFWQWMPGASGLVVFDGNPPIVPDELINKIRQRVNEINQSGPKLSDSFRSGDKVLIQSGPFDGYEAIFDSRISGGERVRILLKMIAKRDVILDLPASHIRKRMPKSNGGYYR